MLSYPRLKLLIWYRAWQAALSTDRGKDLLDHIIQGELHYQNGQWFYCQKLPTTNDIRGIGEGLRDRVIALAIRIFDVLSHRQFSEADLRYYFEKHRIHTSTDELNLAFAGLVQCGMIRLWENGMISRGEWPKEATDEEWAWIRYLENGSS